MLGAINNLGPCTDQALVFPIGEQLDAEPYCRVRAASACQQSQGVFVERQSQPSGFRGKLAFPFWRQIEIETHEISFYLLRLYQTRRRNSRLPPPISLNRFHHVPLPLLDRLKHLIKPLIRRFRSRFRRELP